MNRITVRDGKGQKDRVTLLPEAVKPLFADHMEQVRAIHHQDLSQGHGRVYLPGALTEKYPRAEREWGWRSSALAKRRDSNSSMAIHHSSLLRNRGGRGVRDAFISWGGRITAVCRAVRLSYLSRKIVRGKRQSQNCDSTARLRVAELHHLRLVKGYEVVRPPLSRRSRSEARRQCLM